MKRSNVRSQARSRRLLAAVVVVVGMLVAPSVAPSATADGPGEDPVISTSLVDAADDDRFLPWDGGTATDTITYQNLTPDTRYTVTGELMDKADGTPTGITATTTFTATQANGTVDVQFTIPKGFTGKTLVAFQQLHEGTDTSGDPIATHEDLDDPDQTIVLMRPLKGADPRLTTSLVDTADGDRILPWNGGTATDTITYKDLTPGLRYQITGELMNKADGTPTGITATTDPFVPADFNGTVEVTFTIPEGYAGTTLVAFQRAHRLYDNGRPPATVARHEDLNDPNQTITIEQAPPAPAPVISTSLVDAADGDRVLPWDGGTATDTITYENLTPDARYTVTGELMDKADGTPTGITASTTFTATEAEGSVSVRFVVPEGYAGKSLVAFQQLHEGTDTSSDPIATHEDLDDAAQTVTIASGPPPTTTPTTLPPTTVPPTTVPPTTAPTTTPTSAPAPTDPRVGGNVGGASSNRSRTVAGSNRSLATTGSSLSGIAFGAGVLLIATGTVLVMVRRRGQGLQ